MPTLAALSAVPPCPLVNYEDMAKLQVDSPDLTLLAAGGRLRLQLFTVSGLPLVCDVSTSVPRPLVPAAARKQVFLAVHGLAHPGVCAATHLVSSKFVWPPRRSVRKLLQIAAVAAPQALLGTMFASSGPRRGVCPGV